MKREIMYGFSILKGIKSCFEMICQEEIVESGLTYNKMKNDIGAC